MKYFGHDHRVGVDTCAIESMDQQNEKANNYMLFDLYNGKNCDDASMRDLREFATENNFTYRGGYGFTTACEVDNDSRLRIENETKMRMRNQMFTRTFQAVPDLSRGDVNVVNESKMQQGVNTYGMYDCEEKPFDTFTPMLPCLASSVQDVRHIIPEWQRGGESTRDTLKQKEFLEKNGYHFDGLCLNKSDSN